MHPSDFSALYQSSYSYIYQLVFSVGQNHQAAEDTVQEIFLAAWVRFRGSPHPNPFGWLILTARHKAYDMLRRQMREARHFVPLDFDAEYTALSIGLFTTDETVLAGDECPYSRILPLLKREDFNLLIAHYDHGITIAELSEKLNISSGACYMRLSRAKKKLLPLLRES